MATKIAPFINVIGQSGRVLHEFIESFTYKYSEEEDDVCELVIKSEDPMMPDNPDFKESSTLTVKWGWLDTGEYNQRKVYIFDTSCQYTETGIQLTLICHERFAISKMDAVQPKKADGKNVIDVLLSSDTVKALNIEDPYQHSLYKTLEPVDRNVSDSPRDRVVINRVIDEDDESSRSQTMKDQQEPRPIGNRVTTDEHGAMTFTVFNGNNSTYRTLRDYFNHQPGGPFVIDSRDDTVIIRTRDFTVPPKRVYDYKGDIGGMLSFTPETKNRSRSRGSENMSATGWDPSTKTPLVGEAGENNEVPSGNDEANRLGGESIYRLITLGGSRDLRTFVELNGYTPGSKLWAEKNKGQATSPTPGKGDAGDLGHANNKSPTAKELLFGPRTSMGWSMGFIKKLPERPQKRGPYVKGWGPGFHDMTPPTKKVSVGRETPERTQGFAGNRQANEALEKNPASAKLIGDPALESGQVITVRNVAKKHAGKYYIKEVTHTLDESGYITDIGSMVAGTGPGKGKGSGQGKGTVGSKDANTPLWTTDTFGNRLYRNVPADIYINGSAGFNNIPVGNLEAFRITPSGIERYDLGKSPTSSQSRSDANINKTTKEVKSQPVSRAERNKQRRDDYHGK